MDWLFFFFGYILGKSNNKDSSSSPTYVPSKEYSESEPSRTLIYSKKTGELLRTRANDKICINHEEHEYNEYGALYSGECSYKDYSPDGKLLTDSYQISPLNEVAFQQGSDFIYSTKNRKLLRKKVYEPTLGIHHNWKEYSSKGELLETGSWSEQRNTWIIQKEPRGIKKIMKTLFVAKKSN